jgi:spore germination protein GerM
MRVTRRLTIVLLVACLACLAGCGGGSGGNDAGSGTTTPVASVATTAPSTATTGTATSSRGDETVTVYFADSDATELQPETRSVPQADLRAALVELANGPSEAGHQNALPAGTAIVGTNVQGDEALVNLSSEFTTGYPPGGAAAEFAVLAPLVYTATAVPGVERVRITVDGQTPSPAGSQYDWTGSFSRADFPGALASP